MKPAQHHSAWCRQLRRAWMPAALLTLCGCLVGPDYRRPAVTLPAGFKEVSDWAPAEANPAGALASTWWTMFGDATLDDLVARSLQANQSVIGAEAAYRVALAEVAEARAALYPTLGASLSGTRSNQSGGSGAASASSTSAAGAASGSATPTRVANSVVAELQASWEPDLWGSVRRNIESNADLAQASDAQLAGERLSIAAAVATDYFLLRQADLDLEAYLAEEALEKQLEDMTADAVRHGTASNDDLLTAQNNVDAASANVENEKAVREIYEHAIAALIGVPPAEFSLPRVPHWTFVAPAVPATLPSVLLERRPDVVGAERTAAAANARIGVADAAFYPTLDLTADAGLVATTLPRLVTVPTRIWSLGPTLADTIFDGGARSAAADVARATYDEDVAAYRATVLNAFENVEDSLSAIKHVRQQDQALLRVYQRSEALYRSALAQQSAGTASPETVLNAQLTLVAAQQNWADTESVLAQDTVALIKNLGGGWDGATGSSDGASARTAALAAGQEQAASSPPSGR